MFVSEHLGRAKNPIFSYEIVPPPRGRSVKEIIDVVEALQPLEPPWIDVTSHSSVATYIERPDGSIDKKTIRKRPGTLGICGIIQNRFKIDIVAHLLCSGFSKEETEDALIELGFLGVHNVLALRGDQPDAAKKLAGNAGRNRFASDLVEQISDMKRGQFIEEIGDAEKIEFCVGVSGYPEKHFEAPSLKSDIQNLKRKVDAGAQYIVTQMFFDNAKYFEFVRLCREGGITIPIIPGLKILRSEAQLRTLPKAFHIDVPDALVEEIQSKPQHALEIGTSWALRQSQELLEAGVACLHYYVLNDVDHVVEIVKRLKK